MFIKIKKKQVLDSLARHKDISLEFLNQIKTLPKEILENVGTDLAKKAVAMSREVDSDLHEHKAFLRMSVSPHGILYAKSDKMKHNNEEELLKFFQKRFPSLIILFESKRGTFAIEHNSSPLIFDKSLEQLLKDLEELLPMNPLLIGLNEKNYQELWESFAQSQIIHGRRASKQLTNLSKKWRRTVVEDQVTFKKLDDFFEI